MTNHQVIDEALDAEARRWVTRGCRCNRRLHPDCACGYQEREEARMEAADIDWDDLAERVDSGEY